MAVDLAQPPRQQRRSQKARPGAGTIVVSARRRPPIGQWILTAAVLGWVGLMILVPAGALLKTAFEPGLARFWTSVTSEDALQAFGLTIGLATVATVVNTIFGVAFAIVLVRRDFWGKSLADGLVDLPFAVSPVIAGLMLVVLYGPASWLGSQGFRVVYAWPGMVLANLFVTLPFVVREVVPVLREFGVDQEEVAHTLGAGRWTTFWRVTLPSIRWGLVYGITLTIGRSLGEFGALLVVSGNILGRTQTATLFVHDRMESFAPEGSYAASVVLAGTSFLMLLGMEAVRKRVAAREGRADMA